MRSKLVRGKKNRIHISSFSNLTIRIFVIGYKNEGEANLVIFLDGDKAVFSMIIDCFEQEGLNLTQDILNLYKIKSLDFACWTHPHDDHSPGFGKVVSQCLGEKTRVYLPDFKIERIDEEVLKRESTSAKEVLKDLEELAKGRSLHNPLLLRINVNVGDENKHHYTLVDQFGNEKPVYIQFFTPFKHYIDNYGFRTDDCKIKNLNELSISFVLSVDNYKFYFGGDTEGKHANLIHDDDIADIRWVKVPHHCSNGAKKLAKRLATGRLDSAASTVFSPQLPIPDVQKIYKNRCRLFMTQLNESRPWGDYGIIQFDYRFEIDKVKISIKLFDNACEYTFDTPPVLQNFLEAVSSAGKGLPWNG